VSWGTFTGLGNLWPSGPVEWMMVDVPGLYVALGDSMSIDDYAGGAGRGAASLLYRNRDGEFPGWTGRDLSSAGLTAQILARDGATAAEVLERQLPHIEQHQIRRTWWHALHALPGLACATG